MILSSIISSFFEQKYENSDLSQDEMMSLINEKHGMIEMLKMLSMFVISLITFIIISNILVVENIVITSLAVSIVNSMVYIFIFKSK